MLIIMTALLQWLRGTQADICLCASSHLNSNTVMTAHLCLDAHSFVLLLFSPPSFSPSLSLSLSPSLSLSLSPSHTTRVSSCCLCDPVRPSLCSCLSLCRALALSPSLPPLALSPSLSLSLSPSLSL